MFYPILSKETSLVTEKGRNLATLCSGQLSQQKVVKMSK